MVDPADLRWIWLTHTDFDHIGSLPQLLADNPEPRVITTFLAVGILSPSTPLPMDRIHLLNPGQKITVGDRTLTAVKPPAFDNPSTTGFVDDTSRSLSSSDCFGALLADVPHSAADLTDDELRQAQVFWATVDSPWLHRVDSAGFAKELNRIREIDPTMILSSHATGYALCHTPLGPCDKQTTHQPILASTENEAGTGGASVITGPAGDHWLAYHAWTPGAIGYHSGGARSLNFTSLTWDTNQLAVTGQAPPTLRTTGSMDGLPSKGPPLEVAGVWPAEMS